MEEELPCLCCVPIAEGRFERDNDLRRPCMRLPLLRPEGKEPTSGREPIFEAANFDWGTIAAWMRSRRLVLLMSGPVVAGVSVAPLGSIVSKGLEKLRACFEGLLLRSDGMVKKADTGRLRGRPPSGCRRASREPFRGKSFNSC